jgi:multidrug efflux system membrane fusion protein
MAPKAPQEAPYRTAATTAPHSNGTASVTRTGSALTPVPQADTAALPKTAKRKSGLGVGLWTLLLVIILGAGGAYYYFYLMPGQKPADSSTSTTGTGAGKHGKGAKGADTIRVVTAPATRGDIGVYLVGLGAVTPLNTVTVKTRVNGQLMKVNFTEGQMVKEGDHLIQIDDRPYKAQLEQYKAQKEHDEALLENAQIDEQRYETLWKQDSIPQQTLATQQSLVKQDQGTVDSDQALIDQTQLNVDYCDITAPVGGRVGLRLVDQGNYVQTSDANGLLVIAQLQPITVIFTIAEDDVPAVMDKINANQTLAVEALDRAQKKELATGSLLTTDNQIDPSTGTLKLKAIFQNTDNALFPNQFVNARLLVDTKKDVIIVPVAAIQYGTQNSTFVYVVNNTDPKNATVSVKNVVTGTLDGDKIEVQSGVDEGDIVVTDGVDKLQNGSKVIVSVPGQHKHSGDGASTADAANG